METAVMVDEAIQIEKRLKEDKKRLEELKGRLAGIALQDMENKNLKFKQLYGRYGIFNALYRDKFEIDNFETLQAAVGALAREKINRVEKVDFEVENRFKKALIAVFKGDYSRDIDLDGILGDLGLGSIEAEVARKKLKGEYKKDRKLLESLGAEGELEEELDAIRLYKNYELIKRFFGELTHEKAERIRRAVFVEESLSVGLEYDG